jgi:hypothetical protein
MLSGAKIKEIIGTAKRIAKKIEKDTKETYIPKKQNSIKKRRRFVWKTPPRIITLQKHVQPKISSKYGK